MFEEFYFNLFYGPLSLRPKYIRGCISSSICLKETGFIKAVSIRNILYRLYLALQVVSGDRASGLYSGGVRIESLPEHHDFPKYLQANVGTLPVILSRPFPFTFFPLHY